MCGIAGYVNFNKKSILNFSAGDLLNVMKNRGPNFQSSFEFKNLKYSLNLFSSRLSIIDLEKRSNQPFRIGNYTLVFNGEIYNYLELKNKLKKLGHQFKTNSDTEVLLKSFIQWGRKCDEMFDGMWAYAIFDKKMNRLYFSRDNFGQKPFYYYYDENNLVFGSEIKYLFKIGCLKEINNQKLEKYLNLGYRSIYQNNQTFFKNIKSLESGTNLEIDLVNKKILTTIYFKKKINSINLKDKDPNIHNPKKLLEILLESLEKKLRCDVPLAYALSGGIDSSALVCLSKKILNKDINCYSIIDKSEEYNEIKNIKILEKDLNIESNKIFLKREKTFLEDLEQLIIYHDSPLSTISYYVHSKLSKEVSKNHKVIISGTGADELFCGYYDHFLIDILSTNSKKKILDWKKNIRPLVRNKNFKDINTYKKVFKTKNYFKNSNNQKIFKKSLDFKEYNLHKDKLRNRNFNELFYETVPCIVHDDDMNSMKYSIENRSPFLDKEIFNYIKSYPSHLNISNGYGKFLLRQSLEGIVPKEILWDKRKIGFNANINTMMKLDPSFLYMIVSKNEFLNKTIDIGEVLNDYKINRLDNKFIFAIINVYLFLKNFEV